jgi:HEAT repeats
MALFVMKCLRCFGKFNLVCSILLLLMSDVSLAAAEQQNPAKESVEWRVVDDKNSQFQLEVKEIPLERIFSTITTKTGVPIHYSVVPEGLVTATCVGTTIKQVMECLLDKRADLIVRYAKPTASAQTDKETKVADLNQPIEMWVLGSKYTNVANCSGSTVTQHTIDNTPLKLAESQEKSVEVEPDQTDELLKMAKSKDAIVRADSIGALMAAGREGDPNVRAALEEALADPNANVRAQAISSLAHREGSGAIDAIQEALHDSDAGVRLMAIDGAGDNTALLQQSVNDDDESVRNLAISKLEELQKKTK